MRTHAYRAFGLAVASAIELPEFAPTAHSAEPDIRITLEPARFADWLAEAAEPGAFTRAADGACLLHVPEAGLYRVRGGSEIRIAPAPAADPGFLRLFTIGSAMGMALHQRGILVLHGATIAHGGTARIIVGDSGAGKSTLAARLGRAGCTVLGDDTMALFPPASTPAPGQGGRWLWQGSRVFKLWQDSLEEMGLESAGLDRLGNRADKFYVPNPGRAADAGARMDLAEILVLEDGEGAPRLSPLSGLHALRAVAQNTYRPEYVALLGREAAHFRQCGALAREVPVSRLVRPWGAEHFAPTVDLVLGRWTETRARSAP